MNEGRTMVAEGMMLRTRFSPSAYYSLKIARFVVRIHASTSILQVIQLSVHVGGNIMCE